VETEQLGQAGAEKYRAWMRNVGIMDRFTLETHAGDIVAGSSAPPAGLALEPGPALPLDAMAQI
jgi:hypothetical protein